MKKDPVQEKKTVEYKISRNDEFLSNEWIYSYFRSAATPSHKDLTLSFRIILEVDNNEESSK